MIYSEIKIYNTLYETLSAHTKKMSLWSEILSHLCSEFPPDSFNLIPYPKCRQQAVPCQHFDFRTVSQMQPCKQNAGLH